MPWKPGGEYLETALLRLSVKLELIESCAAHYNLPNHYDGYTALMKRQCSAIEHFLRFGGLGCAPETLLYDKSLIEIPHNENIAFITKQADRLEDTARAEFLKQSCRELEHIRMDTHVVQWFSNYAHKMMSKRNKA